MGSRGPMPKRREELLGHVSKAKRQNVDQVTVDASVAIPTMPRGLHPIARRWWRSLAASGQAQFYEPSDWAAAEYVAHAMTRSLAEGAFKAGLFHEVFAAMEALLTTEEARRRAGIEVTRTLGAPADDEDDDGPASLAEYREALRG